jgi:hypothetical protein
MTSMRFEVYLNLGDISQAVDHINATGLADLVKA